MKAEITTQRINTKWHGYIEGRPDIDETALTEEAVRRRMEQLRERIGMCGAKGSGDGRELSCELIARHHAPGNRPTSHSADGILWMGRSAR
jgi:hypothetical protein